MAKDNFVKYLDFFDENKKPIPIASFRIREDGIDIFLKTKELAAPLPPAPLPSPVVGICQIHNVTYDRECVFCHPSAAPSPTLPPAELLMNNGLAPSSPTAAEGERPRDGVKELPNTGHPSRFFPDHDSEADRDIGYGPLCSQCSQPSHPRRSCVNAGAEALQSKLAKSAPTPLSAEELAPLLAIGKKLIETRQQLAENTKKYNAEVDSIGDMGSNAGSPVHGLAWAIRRGEDELNSLEREAAKAIEKLCSLPGVAVIKRDK